MFKTNPIIDGLLRRVLDHQLALLEGCATVESGRQLSTELRSEAARWLGASDAEQLACGVAIHRAGVAIGFGAHITGLAASLRAIREVTAALAARYAAEAALELTQARARAVTPPTTRSTDPATPGPRRATPIELLSPAALAAMTNIARYHRAHERYYAQHLGESASSLLRDANRLRIVAELWLGDAPGAPLDSIDASDPRYRVLAGPDLNSLVAVPAIGILFMEGEGTPPELLALTAKLRGAAVASMTAGAWLLDKMEAALVREHAHLAGHLADGAQARLGTIGVNWCGAEGSLLCGRLLDQAATRLGRLDLRPASIRAQRASTGSELLQLAWTLALVAGLQASFSSQLGDNDRDWTAYIAVLEERASSP